MLIHLGRPRETPSESLYCIFLTRARKATVNVSSSSCRRSLRRDRGIYSIKGGRSLYCLHFGFSQFLGPEAYSLIFVPVLLG